MQIQASFPFKCVVIGPLVREPGFLLYKCGDLKLYLCRPWQIIILGNFWDFLWKVFIPLKFKSNLKYRKLLNSYFKICAGLDVWPRTKDFSLDQIYHPQIFHNFLGQESLIFYFWIRTFEVDLENHSKFKRGSGPPVNGFQQPLAR
jgi:hypothetical protein